jgi:hypothetical protein
VPAYAKITLVTAAFHPSDVAFVEGWSARAPGIDGWRVAFDGPGGVERVSITPPGATSPVFFITRYAGRALIQRLAPPGSDEALEEVGEFPNLRKAVLALCPLTDEDLQEIHEQLERDFPRRERR